MRGIEDEEEEEEEEGAYVLKYEKSYVIVENVGVTEDGKGS